MGSPRVLLHLDKILLDDRISMAFHGVTDVFHVAGFSAFKILENILKRTWSFQQCLGLILSEHSHAIGD
jgi:hypothetical protein